MHLDGEATALADEELEPIELRYLRRHMDVMESELGEIKAMFERLENKLDFVVEQFIPRGAR